MGNKLKRASQTWTYFEALFLSLVVATLIVVGIVLDESSRSSVGFSAPKKRLRGSQFGLVNRTRTKLNSTAVMEQRLRRLGEMKEPRPQNGLKFSLARIYMDRKTPEEDLLADDALALNETEDEARIKLRTLCNDRACYMANVMRRRTRRLAQRCNDGVFSDSLNFPRLFVLKYRELVWCPVYKAGSTNWMKKLPALSNYGSADLQFLDRWFFDRPNEFARFVAPEITSEDQLPSDFVSFLVVRHPFHRLASAFRDKLSVGKRNAHFFGLYGADIVTRWRSEAKGRFPDLAFEPPEAPIFWEFVSSVIHDDLHDEHWAPISASCGLCDLNYDFILKLESFAEDERFMMTSLGLDRFFPTRTSWENRRGTTNSASVSALFRQLNGAEIEALVELYKEDFDFFEYDPNEIFVPLS